MSEKDEKISEAKGTRRRLSESEAQKVKDYIKKNCGYRPGHRSEPHTLVESGRISCVDSLPNNPPQSEPQAFAPKTWFPFIITLTAVFVFGVWIVW